MRLALAAAFLVLAVPALAQSVPPLPPSITVSGEGRVSAKPDMATLSSGVVTEAKTAGEALSANSKAMETLLASFKASGVEDRDLSTSGFSVQPKYDYQPNRTGDPRIIGYTVTNTLSVTIRDLSKLGAILDKAVTDGSNQINGLSFDIDKKAPLQDEARKEAFADAKRKADIYAAAAGVKLGKLRDLSEQGGGFIPPRPMVMRNMAAKADSVPVAEGEQDVQINVTATWEIAP